MAPVVTVNYVRFVSTCEIQWFAHAMGQSVLKPTWYSHGRPMHRRTPLAPTTTGFVCSQFCYNARIVFLRDNA